MRIVIKVGAFPLAHSQMLAEFLLDKINFDIMLDFVSSAENLKLFMTLLCSKYPTIQFEAFNVFKVDCTWIPLMRRFLLRILTSRMTSKPSSA